jgi:hypothetical protein
VAAGIGVDLGVNGGDKFPTSLRSVAPVSARRLDRGEIIEVEIDDILECLGSGAVAQAFGQGVGPSSIFGL